MKNKIYILSIFTFVFCSSLSGQSWAWAKSGGGSAASSASAICVDANGNYFVTGWFTLSELIIGTTTLVGTPSITPNYYVAKFGSNGNFIQARGCNGGARGESICTDANGNCYVGGAGGAGTSFGTYTIPNFAVNFLIKYDPNGNIQWATSGLYSSDFESLSLDQSGNIIAAGAYLGTGAVFGSYTLANSMGADIYFAKFNSINGNAIWARCIQGGAHETEPSVSCDNSGNIYLSGLSISSAIISGTNSFVNSGKTFLMKFDNGGNLIWFRAPIGNRSAIHDIENDNSGNIYVTGQFGGSNVAFGNFTLTASLAHDVTFLTKYDPAGNVLWVTQENWNSAGTAVDEYQNNIYVAGFYLDSLMFGSYKAVMPQNASSVMYLTRFDDNGNCNFLETLNNGGLGYPNVCVDKFCNPVIAGTYDNIAAFTVGPFSLSSSASSNLFLAKLSINCFDGMKEIENGQGVKVFPNPTTGEFNLTGLGDCKEIVVRNFLGSVVFQQMINTNNQKIDLRGIPGGIYLFSILKADHRTVTGKFVIE